MAEIQHRKMDAQTYLLRSLSVVVITVVFESINPSSNLGGIYLYAPVAKLERHLTSNQETAGSNPVRGIYILFFYSLKHSLSV